MTLLRWKEIVKPGEAFHTARVTYNRRSPVPYHRHDFAEVFWVDEGKGTHRVNGMKQSLETGTVVFVRPQDAHSIEAGGRLRFTNIAFAGGTLDFLGERYFGRKGGAWWNKKMLPEMRTIDARQRTLFNRWADELARSPRELFAIERFLMNVLAELDEAEERRLPPETPDWLAQACREIRKPELLAEGPRLSSSWRDEDVSTPHAPCANTSGPRPPNTSTAHGWNRPRICWR